MSATLFQCAAWYPPRMSLACFVIFYRGTVEILANVIRSDTELQGFKVRSKSIKIMQLADDMQSKKKSLTRVLNITDECGKYAGLKLNREIENRRVETGTLEKGGSRSNPLANETY